VSDIKEELIEWVVKAIKEAYADGYANGAKDTIEKAIHALAQNVGQCKNPWCVSVDKMIKLLSELDVK